MLRKPTKRGTRLAERMCLLCGGAYLGIGGIAGQWVFVGCGIGLMVLAVAIIYFQKTERYNSFEV